ncbi:MAG: 16S rRNA methyltransferase [Aeropyrum sp.]|nr:16S rRNA methyltransferase [Aeropyrum sp.]MCE4615503.1 16S rRNA methyltransferase [Aeropyrum sp.]
MAGGWGRVGLSIVFLESSLELVPRDLWRHPQVVRSSERYGIEPWEMVLDKSLHYNAMSGLSQKWKRGRPDILHTSLLVVSDTPLYNEGLLRVYFQSYDGRIFSVRPGVRVPKHYERFKGLMAQLLRVGRVPPSGSPLIEVCAQSLQEFVGRYGRLLLLDEGGEPSTPIEIAAKAISSGGIVGIGAFPRGPFKRSTLRKAASRHSILGGRPLKTWGVAGRIVWALERLAGLS